MGKVAGNIVAIGGAHEVDEPTRSARGGALARRRSEENRHYPWAKGYLSWLDGKEARDEYYALLERTSPR